MSSKVLKIQDTTYKDFLLADLRKSPIFCGEYLLAAAKDSPKAFDVALRDIREAYPSAPTLETK